MGIQSASRSVVITVDAINPIRLDNCPKGKFLPSLGYPFSNSRLLNYSGSITHNEGILGKVGSVSI